MVTLATTLTYKFSQRRRAKDATLALLRTDLKAQLKVCVTGQQEYWVTIALDTVNAEDAMATVKGIFANGSLQSDDWIDIESCEEFYQGAGLSRFRGI